MAGLLFTLLVVGLTLTVLLWAGTVFLQGYFYTEASTDVFWQAPAAGAALTLFYASWCLLDYNAEGARPGYLPYDTLFRFSAEESREAKPVPRLWAVRKVGKLEQTVPYKRKTVGPGRYEYVEELPDKTEGGPYRPQGVVALEIEEEGRKVRYAAQKSESSDRRDFVGPDGWVIKESGGMPDGQPTAFRGGLFLMNVLLNFLHLGIWFVCLWLLLRFTWGRALALGFVMWLAMSLIVVPMLLVRAGAAAQETTAPQQIARLFTFRALQERET